MADAAILAKELRDAIETLPPQMFGGDLSRDIILEACARVENPENVDCKVQLPPEFVPASCLPRTVVGILGGTGTGKSTLLAGLLEKNILSISGSRRGTSFPTIIVYHELHTIDAAISYMSEDDFRKHVDTAIDLVQLDDQGQELTLGTLKSDPSFSLLVEALDIKRSYLYQAGMTSQKVLDDYPEVRDRLGTTRYVSATTESQFRRETTGKMNRRTGHAQYKPWPLINSMVVKCNSRVLAEGTILVDLPGSFDISATILHTVATFKNKLQFTLATAPIKRSDNNSTLSGLMDDEIVRQQRMHVSNARGDAQDRPMIDLSTAPALAAIITQCDATTNVRYQELENDDGIGELLQADERYLAVVERCDELEASCLEVKEEKEELAKSASAEGAGDEVTKTLSSLKLGLKRSRSDPPEDEPEAKRRRVGDVGMFDSVKLETSLAGSERHRASELKKTLDGLQEKLRACKLERQLMVSAVRSQVACGEIRRQYREKAKTTVKSGARSSLPVFATSAIDFTELVENAVHANQPVTDTDLERTGIPAVRAFVRNLGAREQRSAALRVLAPFLAQVISVSNHLNAVENEGIGAATPQKLAMMARWSSRSGPKRLKVEDVGGVGNGPVQVKHEGMGLQATLKAAFNIILKSEMDGVRRKLSELETACTTTLAGLASDHIPQTVEKIIHSIEDRQWGIWKATLRRCGVYRDKNWNVDLAEPLVASTTQPREDLFNHWKLESLPTLQFKMIHAVTELSSVVAKSARGGDGNLEGAVSEHACRAMPIVDAEIHKIARIITQEVHDTDERDSRPLSLVEAVRLYLKPMYEEACELGGKGSTMLQKALVKKTIQERADAMFKQIVQEFIQARRATIDRVELKLTDALEHTAKEVEATISKAWVVAGYDVEEIAARAHAAHAVSNIRGRLVDMEAALKHAMERADEDIPSCYPPLTNPDDD